MKQGKFLFPNKAKGWVIELNTFSYCGIPSSKFGCYYAASDTERFYSRSDYTVYSDEPDWYHGGIYYGSVLKPREFELNCWYEDIDRKTKERMLSWLDRRTSGRLVFDQWPWKYYHVRPTKRVNGKEYTHDDRNGHDVYSGAFTIYFTAYEPWAYIDGDHYDQVNDTISFFVSDEWNLGVSMDLGDDSFTPVFTLNDDKALYVLSDSDHLFTINSDGQMIMSRQSTEGLQDYLYTPDYSEEITANTRTVNLYNIGTETTYPVIRIGGMAENGLIIRNETNGTECGVCSLPPSSGYLEIDCANGVVYHVDGSNKNIEFSYHDLGFIALDPCGIVDYGVQVSCTAGSNVVQITDRDYEQNAIGKYMILGGVLYQITNKTSAGYIISGRPTVTTTETVELFAMNHIRIIGQDISLNRLEIEFVPRVQ